MAILPKEAIPNIIAEFPRISNSLALFWGSRDFDEFVGKLLITEADRTRSGFPPYIISELNSLQDLHNKTFPQFAAEREKFAMATGMNLFKDMYR